MTTTAFRVPAADTVRELAAFVQARAAEGEQLLLRRVPAEQHDTPDFTELLRIPRALGLAAEIAAYELEGELLADRPDADAVRLLWRTLLNTAQPFHAHPDVPAGAREALAAVDGM
ncbi:hypothetical protein [Streptomyces graminilatus]|uniref:hypothetical protein n=1 Tax=Streptomyces graminilatus TaxID=1464070 RepID=UPI0006E31926|nr:hypothetical protein [Streptomyces graminilatus]